MKPSSAIITDDVGYLRTKAYRDLENAIFKLERATANLDRAMRVLIYHYPHLATLADKLPEDDVQHPYQRILQKACEIYILRQKKR